ncbi:hypothetical protein GCM10023323_43520 [Streptomyces thinghirensis]|uniref:Transposase n=1 Tax=Streptomyces thinghirensis TaxID=551547 RepID=A0ABP9T602_9ACTN
MLEGGGVEGFGGAPADAGVAAPGVVGPPGVWSRLCRTHDHLPLLSIPPKVTDCQIPWLLRKLGRGDTPGYGRSVTGG